MNNILQKYYEEYKEDWYNTKEKIKDHYDDFDERGDIIIDLLDEMVDRDKEIDRLNNVINELEKWLKGLIENFDEDVSEPILHEQMTIRLVYEYLDKLKELKEKK